MVSTDKIGFPVQFQGFPLYTTIPSTVFTSVGADPDPPPDPNPFFKDFKDAKIFILQALFSPLNTYMRKGKDPNLDPYL
jgi:hypothetical protein